MRGNAVFRRPANSQRGVASIEFALGFFAFFLMCITWMEIGYMAHVSSVTDVAVAEAARKAKLTSMEHGGGKTSAEFMKVFKQVVARETANYGGLVDSSKFRFSVQYLKSIEELGRYTGECRDEDDATTELECGDPEFSAIAVYGVEYDFTPLLSQFIAEPGMFRREVIVVQEYERDAFNF